MANNYLLDTNIVIYYFDGVFSNENKEIDIIFENNFTVSIITKIEFLGWVGFSDQ
ncbi:MAG TPA: hypothetical protein PKN50_02435 [Spirochaetota bacterium]|nr:hypothetical protein [Spirochaetota bacterium]HPV43149.1 hypothetical protein [Spirochaetota bacterium]